MKEPLESKLRDFENRLRTLRPLEVDLGSPEGMQVKPKKRRYFRDVFIAVPAAVPLVVVALVFYGAREQIVPEGPGPAVVKTVFPAESPESRETPVFSTVRSQLASLLEEMPPLPTEPSVKHDYPVIEITVSRTSIEVRDEFSGILRGGSRIDFDPEKPFFF